MYKFNLSKKNQKRLKIIDTFYSEKNTIKSFSEKNLNKIFYFKGKQSVIDILSYKLFISKIIDKNLVDQIEIYKSKILPTMPVGANILMTKYDIPEGKNLGNKLKLIEEKWVHNNFKLSEKQIEEIINR